MDSGGGRKGTGGFAIRAKKEFGQNFLVQPAHVRIITEAALACPAQGILEIGPGPGTLTNSLAEDGRPLWAVELDPEACEHLEAEFRDRPQVRLLRGDAVTLPLPAGPTWTVVGNLPYNAATPILTRFLLEPIPWEQMVFMFQLEVAQKLTGEAGTKAYGPLGILAQLCTRMTRLLRLGPGAFHPPPKVESAVLRFEPRPGAPPLDLRGPLLDLLHRSFALRRKTLFNNWQGWLGAERARAILDAEGLPPAIRAEAIPPPRWPALLARIRGGEDGAGAPDRMDP